MTGSAPRLIRQHWVTLAAIAWVLALALGFTMMWRYKSAPGLQSQAADTWPVQSQLTRDPERATLLMFVHPHCACSEASLTELENIVQHTGERLRTQVVMVHPKGTLAGWEAGGLIEHAKRIPNVDIVHDTNGAEMAAFGAKTSGACLLYSRDGKKIFSGGITSIRGHVGDSLGEERIIALVKGEQTDRHDSPVFGCALESEHARGGEDHGR